MRTKDGGAGDADYGAIGRGYARRRDPDHRIARQIVRALGESLSVVNVGAGAGGYEPRDRTVTPVEPSAAMRAQRPADAPPAVDGVAASLPFPDQSFDAAMTTFSVHQWPDAAAGLREMRRVARGPVVVLTCDPDALGRWWLHDYAPEITAVERRRFPPIGAICDALGGEVRIESVPVPFDCADLFNEAYFARPEGLLEAEARTACSSWSFVGPEVTQRFVEALGADLADGAWDRKHGRFRTLPTLPDPIRLVVGLP